MPRPGAARRILRHAVVPGSLGLDLVLWGGNGSTRLGFNLSVPLVSVLTAAAFAVLLVRSRRPALAYTVMWLHAVTFGLLIPAYQPFAGLLVALYQFARFAPLRRGIWALLLTAVPVAIAVMDTATLTATSPIGVVTAVVIWCVIVGTDWVAGRLARRTHQVVELQQQKLAAEAALALTEQRVLLARDLHDVVASAVTLMVIQASGARRLPADDHRVGRLLASIESGGVQAIQELREVLTVLSPVQASTAAPALLGPAPTQRTARHGLHALPALLDRIGQSGVIVSTDVDSVPALPVEIDEVAYRVVQESLVNVAKHAGAGAHCQLSIRTVDGRLHLRVSNRVGTRQPTDSRLSIGRGLDGLRVRVETVGGQLLIEPRTDSGYSVFVSIPVLSPGVEGCATHDTGGQA